MTTKYAIQLAYDGTEFCGWQIQRGVGDHKNPRPSIEGLVTAAVEKLCREEINLVASGRTDAGVHASGQVAHFELQTARDSDEHFLDGLNALLPDAIQIHRLGQVPTSFRAQRAIQKQYSYYFSQGPTKLPHLHSYTMWNRYPLDEDKMQLGVQHLIGRHDFLGFCSANADVSSTIREIYDAEVTRESIPPPGCFDPARQSLIRVRLLGSGFLKHMVRTIAGTLKQIGEGRRPPEALLEILTSRDREQAGPTAPANGLWLDQVWYDAQTEIKFLDQTAR